MIPFVDKWYYTPEMVMGTFEGDIYATREALKEYCRMDTLGMMEILGVLKKSCDPLLL
jgi:hypothetical protein